MRKAELIGLIRKGWVLEHSIVTDGRSSEDHYTIWPTKVHKMGDEGYRLTKKQYELAKKEEERLRGPGQEKLKDRAADFADKYNEEHHLNPGDDDYMTWEDAYQGGFVK